MQLGLLKSVVDEISESGFADDTDIQLCIGSDLQNSQEFGVDGWFNPTDGGDSPVVILK